MLTVLAAVVSDALGNRIQLAHAFLNRDQEIARLFALNVRNNWRTASKEFQSFCFGISLDMHGAGKTTLGDAYLGQLKKKSVRDAVEKQLKTMAVKAGRGNTSSLVQYGMDQLYEMEEERVVRIAVSAGGSMDEIMVKLKGALDRTMCDESCHRSSCDADIHRRLSALCEDLPVFLMIDDIGRLPQHEFQMLRWWLAELFVSSKRRCPLHVYLCGRPSRMEEDQTLGNSTPVAQELLLLQPLGAAHVSQIAERDFNVTLKDLPMDVCGEVANVTGGAPQMIRHVLEAMLLSSPQLPLSIDRVTKTALDIARRRRSDFINIDEPQHLLAFARLAAIQELGYELDLEPSFYDDFHHNPLAQLVSFLPGMTERQEGSGLYNVRCCSLYFTVFSDQLSRLDASKIVLDDPRPASERGDEQQHQLLAYLQRQLMLRLLAERAPGGGAEGSPLTTSLLEWLPVLFQWKVKAENRNPLLAEALWDASEREVQDLLARPLRAYFKPRQLMVTSADENGHAVTPYNLWAALDSLVGPDQTAAVMMTTSDESHRPGVFLHLPADSGPLRLVSFKVKCNEKSADYGEITRLGISDLSDAVKKLPRDMPPGTRQLLVLVADNLSRPLQRAIGEQTLLLTKGKKGTQVISKGRVVLSTLQRGEGKPVADDDVLDVERTLLEELAQCLELLPEGASVAVMKAQQFRGSYGNDQDVDTTALQDNTRR